MKEYIPVILSSDNNYARYMYVAMKSIIENAPKECFHFYLTVPENFSDLNKKLINKCIENTENKIEYINVEKYFNNVKLKIKRITKETYYRILADKFVSKDYKKCIYLDVDVIVVCNLRELFDVDVHNFLIAGVRESEIAKRENIRAKELNLPDCRNYINAGVLLINLEAMRRVKLSEQMLELSLKEFSNQDQDVINIVCYGNIKILPPTFNAIPRNIFSEKYLTSYSANEINEAKTHCKIIHYADNNKPWKDPDVKLGEIWWKIANTSDVDFMSDFDKRIFGLGLDVCVLRRIGDKSTLYLFGLPVFYSSKNKYRILCFSFKRKCKSQLDRCVINKGEDGYKNMIERLTRENTQYKTKLTELQSRIDSIENYLLLKFVPDVSIIVPVFNSQEFLPKSLKCLREQTYCNFEIICVDDGSTDNSRNILISESKINTKLKIILSENKGAANARNIGLKQARGKYVLFLDSDDIFDSKLVENTYKKASETSVDMVLFRAKSYDKTTNITKRAEWALNTKFLPKKEIFKIEDMGDHLFQAISSCPWNKLIKRELLTGLQFQNIRNANDLYLIYTALLRAKSITYLDEYLVTYRTGNPNSLQRTKSNYFSCIFDAYRKLYEQIRNLGLYEKYHRSLINKALESFVYYFNTINEEAKEKMKLYLTDSGFSEFDMFDKDEKFFYRKSDYEAMKKILSE